MEVCVTTKHANQLDVFTNEVEITEAKANNIELSDYFLKLQRRGKLIPHHISKEDYTKLALTFYE
ncbi:MAG: hypothetical protein AAGB24_04650 [Bacteroidota bacterium]